MAFIVQELVSTNTAILLAYQQGLNPLLIHVLFFALTLFDISVGYRLGTWINRDMISKRKHRRLDRYIGKIEMLVGSVGKRVALTLLSVIGFPYFSGFVAAWLGFSSNDAVIYIIPGSILWYAVGWSVVLGAHLYVSNPIADIATVLGISLVLLVAIRLLTSQIFRK